MKYFLQTIRFLPKNPKELGLTKIDDKTYVLLEDSSLWEYRKLLDLGWGKEHGFFRVPLLSVDNLFKYAFDFGDDKLKFVNNDLYNFYGSLAVLMDDFASSLILEIKQRYIQNRFKISDNRFMIKQLNSEFNIDYHLVERLSNSELAKNCVLWKKVYSEIE